MDNDENITLHQHEKHSQARAAHLGAKIDKLKEHDMGTPVNVFTPAAEGGAGLLPAAMMAGMSGNHGLGGAGLGAGLVGGLLGGLLFGGRGLGGWGGGWGGEGIGPRAAAALDGTDGMAIINAIGNVKDTVNAGTASVTATVTNGNMALANAISSGFASQTSDTLQQTIMLVQQANANQLLSMQEMCNINQNVSAQGCQTREAVAADGDKTRAYLAARFQLEDQTEINKLNAKVIELQNEGRTREIGTRIDIQNTAIATQAQTQAQQQQQQILAGINQLFPLVQGVLQVAHATNTNVIAGNQGPVVTGPQTANPTNVNV